MSYLHQCIRHLYIRNLDFFWISDLNFSKASQQEFSSDSEWHKVVDALSKVHYQCISVGTTFNPDSLQ